MKSVQCALALAILLANAANAQQPPADLILVNARVFTADEANPMAPAVAIRGDRIVAVGSIAEMQDFDGNGTRTIDVRGRTVLPGFNDAHFHFSPTPAGIELRFETMEPSWSATLAAIAAATTQSPAGTWIFGSVGHTVILDAHATRSELDEVAPDHPVLLSAYYGHGSVVNSKAMPLLQMSDAEENPLGGEFERVGNRERVNGRMWEYAEWRSARILADQVTDDEAIAQLTRMAGEAVGFGITSMQVMSAMPIERFTRLLRRADLPVRVRATPFSLTTAQGRDLSEMRQLTSLNTPGSSVSVRGIKWVLDGTPFERGAAMRRDYGDRPRWRGRLNFPGGEIAAMVDESLELAQPLLLHAVGDKTIEVVLNTLENNAGIDWPAQRVRLEHGDGLIDDLIPRARALGVVVVQNPSHFTEPKVFHPRWGTTMQPMRTLIEAGIPVALGSDGPMNHYLNILFAIIHPSNPQEAITREQAVRAYTYLSAFAEFAEQDKGSIAAGNLADLTVLSQDVFTVPAAELPNTRSVLTLIGGTPVFDAKVLE